MEVSLQPRGSPGLLLVSRSRDARGGGQGPAQPLRAIPPLSRSARPQAPPSANGRGGSRLGKFPFRFLPPPVPLRLLLAQGASPALHTPVSAEALRALSCQHHRPPGLGHDAGHKVCGGGRWVGTRLDLLTAPSRGSPGPSRPGAPGEAPCPADGGVPRRPPEERLPFSPRAQREPQGWAEDSSTLSAHLTPEAAWVESTGLGLGVPGAPRLHPESWGWSPTGPQASILWMPAGGRGGSPG